MPLSPVFLIHDSRADTRFLLVRTLLRKFPGAVLHECVTPERTLELAHRGGLTAAVVHRADHAETHLLREIRRTNPTAVIIVVASDDQRTSALAAGADRFLHRDEWLRIGSLVEEQLAARGYGTVPAAGAAE